MKVDMSPESIATRLRRASQLAGPLRPEHRLSAKLDLSPSAVASRLREASSLLELCQHLAAAQRQSPP